MPAFAKKTWMSAPLLVRTHIETAVVLQRAVAESLHDGLVGRVAVDGGD